MKNLPFSRPSERLAGSGTMNTLVAAMDNRVAHARSLCERGSWKELLAAGQQWHAESPLDPKPLFYQGVALSVMGRFVEAQTAYRRVLDLDPAEAKAWNNLGAILFESLKQPAEGVKCLAQSLKLDPGNKLGWSNLASMNGQLGRHVQALACAERALALDPHMVEAHLHRGRAAQLLGQPEIVRATCEALASIPLQKYRRAH